MIQPFVLLFRTECSETVANSSGMHAGKKAKLSEYFQLESFYTFSGTFEQEGRMFLLVLVGGLRKGTVSEQQVIDLFESIFADSRWSSFLTAAEARFLPDECANSELNPLFKKRKKQKSFRSIRGLRSALTRFFFFVSKEETIRWDPSLESYDFQELFFRLGQTGPFFGIAPKGAVQSSTDVRAEEFARLERKVESLELQIERLQIQWEQFAVLQTKVNE